MAPCISSHAGNLRVLQWNVLADGLAQRGDFIRVPLDCLLWEQRGPRVIAALLRAEADIVCLQELNHFDDFFFPELQQRGYSGLFHPKKCSPAQRFGCPADGCAIFYNTVRLQLIGSESFVYEEEDGSHMSQGAIICKFREATSEKELLVATTHLKAKGGTLNAAIRSLQTVQLLQK